MSVPKATALPGLHRLSALRIGSRFLAGVSVELPSGEQSRTVTKPTRSSVYPWAVSLAFAFIAIVVAGIILGILKINHGVFTYTLDDPYIHLALSDQIRHGNYGINAGYHAAPSSSILFPLLLVFGSGTAIHPYLPLIYNLLALFLTIEISRRFLIHLDLSDDAFGAAVEAGSLVAAALCFNVVGVAFTGLEHSLHLAAVAATVYGLAIFLDEDRLPAWLPAALVLSPLIRYEGLALSLGALLVLALRGRWRTALATFATILVLLGSFSVFLMKLGLAPLPSSILSKSTVAAKGVGGGAGMLNSVAGNIQLMSMHATGLILLVIGVAAATRCALELSHANPRRWSSGGLMSLALVCLIGGHAVAGKMGWFRRYEDYAMLGAAMMGIYIIQSTIRATMADKKDRLVLVAGAACALLVVTGRYWVGTAQLPVAANNIFEQQMQMHRFVQDFYRGPVAINDLGLVSYHNPYFVLDLGGLASEKARLLAAHHADTKAYQDLVNSSGVHLIMIYDEWFRRGQAGGWIKVGSMDLSRPLLSASVSEVQFYVTDPATAATVREELEGFRKELPAGVKLSIYASPADALRSNSSPAVSTHEE